MQLKRTLFGDPILRTPARRLSAEEIQSEQIQKLIAAMYEYLDSRPKFGVGIAAPQLDQAVAISVISLKPTPYRPDVKRKKLTIINPEIVKTYGRRAGMWEGCISFHAGSSDFPYAQTRRYKKVRLRYLDEQGNEQEADFDGLLGHVVQHETDHLNGILFVDRVRDTSTYMMKSEYIKHYVKPRQVKEKHRG